MRLVLNDSFRIENVGQKIRNRRSFYFVKCGSY